ncbi:MAG: C1 family peptidase [Bacteroidales bacterium]
MKNNLFLLLTIALFSSPLKGQVAHAHPSESEVAYKFETVKELPTTPIKNQNRSSTCWSFAAISFIESELLREGKGEFDLSEMFIVSNAYKDKGEKYIRTSGHINFSPGSSFGDVFSVWRSYGMVPEEAMSGLNYGEERHVHGELDATLAGYIKALVKNPNGKFSPVWREGYQGILDAYLGKSPDSFIYKEKEYTPQSFSNMLGLDPDNYISITSFTHHPFYTQFAIEVPDNWRWELSYNLPLDEFISLFDYAIENGYTVLWASDISENGFSRKGIGVAVETDQANMSGSDQEKWIGRSPQKMSSALQNMSEILPEKKITQELRQLEFDNGLTTDDHGMHIVGIAKDQNGSPYYMVKNSWGEVGNYKGFWYVSKNFVMYKSTNIVIHKNAIPKEIRAKLGIK